MTKKIESRSDIINTLIENNGYKTYLEIGVRDNKNFNRITTPHKDGVDPAGKCNYKMTSDAFFAQIDTNFKYDIVFIDGLHVKDQVLRDVKNSLKHLTQNGTIVMHDCNPLKAQWATPHYPGHGRWHGTVWEAFAELRMTRSDIKMWTVDEDTGCGVIKFGTQELFPKSTIKFSLLEDNRKDLLNLISADEFLELKL